MVRQTKKAGAFTAEDDALLAELGVGDETKQAPGRTPREERILAGFEDIQRFCERHGRAPQAGEDRDIFERLYAVRLERLRRLRTQEDFQDMYIVIEAMDHQGLLAGKEPKTPDTLDDDALLAELGLNEATPNDLTTLRHVRPRDTRRTAEEIASREPCSDFDRFKPLFELVRRELDAGIRSTRPFVKAVGFQKEVDITKGQFFILGGQIAYVAAVGDPLRAPNGERDARLRVVYSNGTESNLLRRSLQRALYKDEAGRRVSEPDAGPLFAELSSNADKASGTIYVLRSLSDHPLVVTHREVLHKIGVTGGDVARRIANAKQDPTFLMADVHIVATYTLYNIHRVKLENLLHRVFAPAQLDIEIQDRFGKPIVPREWFLVPHFIVDEAVARIKDGTITDYVYDPQTARLVRTGNALDLYRRR